MHVSMSEIIGNFILIAGSFLLLIFLLKKCAWNNINGILEARAKKITDDIDGAESARQKAEELASKREEELAGSRKEAASIVENAKETAEKNKQEQGIVLYVMFPNISFCKAYDKVTSKLASTSPAKIFPKIRSAKEAKFVNSSKIFMGVINPGVTKAFKYSFTPRLRIPSTWAIKVIKNEKAKS